MANRIDYYPSATKRQDGFRPVVRTFINGRPVGSKKAARVYRDQVEALAVARRAAELAACNIAGAFGFTVSAH
jgi:hypothetical protein